MIKSRNDRKLGAMSVNGNRMNSTNVNRRSTTNLNLYSAALLYGAILLSCSLLFEGVAGELESKSQHNSCSSKRTCQECLQTLNCGWCLGVDISDESRCAAEMPKNCSQEYWYKPRTEETILLSKELTTSRSGAAIAGGGYAAGSYAQGQASGGHYEAGYSSMSGSESAHGFSATGGDIVQIQPQRLKLKLRINEEHSLRVNFAQAEDYPVDLYYLMDLSKSMEDDKQTLSSLGNDLSRTMSEMTSNFRLGFGSFVDKVLMPYVSTIPKKLEHPCDNCQSPYGYRNHMPLSANTSNFEHQVDKAQVSGNLDAPEGGFDAIMQAIACRSQVGWREQARRLLVFSTDAGFHYAGDGKLGGVIAPNDGDCHLDENGQYSYSTIQDYPSISQINQKVKHNSINIIFAVTQNQHSVYSKLTEQIEGSVSAVLSNNSANVVQLVKENYEKITSSIELKDNASNNVQITYFSSCLGKGPEVQTSKCDGLKVGSRVEFTAKIRVLSCPANKKDWNQVIQIYPVGINESLTIDLELLCSCNCEKEGSVGYEKFSPHCTNAGTYMCGICNCYESHFGRKCECSNTGSQQSSVSSNGCRPDNITQIDCSGRGTCQCGECECHKRIPDTEVVTGRFCECDNFSCERNKNLLCSGPDHGTCECGRCVCKPGWTGNACDCRDTTDTCKASKSDEICSGHGECVCGQCKCKTIDAGRYSGRYCEKCPTCSGRCLELKDCVECQVHKGGPLRNPEDCAANCTFVPISVEKIDIDVEKDEQPCGFYDEDDCKFTFKYVEENNTLKVYAQDKKECPPKVFMLGIVLGVIAAIVLVGLAVLLLWKLLTTIHDRREFARFEKERMNAKWDTGENPIYKQATSTFKNPMYAGK